MNAWEKRWPVNWSEIAADAFAAYMGMEIRTVERRLARIEKHLGLE